MRMTLLGAGAALSILVASSKLLAQVEPPANPGQLNF